MMLRYSSIAGGEARVQRHRGAELLDDRRAGRRSPRRQVGAPQHRGVDVPVGGVEADRRGGPWARPRAPSPSRRPARDLRALDRADAGDPQVDPLDLLGGVAGEVVAVERGVLGVERARPPRRATAWSTGPSGHRHPHLEGLAEVAQVGGADERVLLVGEALLGQRLARLRGERVEDRGDRGRVERVGQRDVGLDVVVLHVDGQQAEGRDVARVRRHQHGRQAEHVDQPAEQQRAGAAEGGQREVADVEAALDGDLAQRVGLVPRGDLEDAGGAGLGRQPELGRRAARCRRGPPPRRAGSRRRAGAGGSGRGRRGRR